jgi:integrase
MISMKEKINSTNGGKEEEQYKCSALLEEEKINREISVQGAENLTNQELLAVIMSGDMEALTAAENLLDTFDSSLVHLFCASVNQLMETEGIRFEEAQKIKATFELTKRIAAYCEEDHPKITSKDDVTKLLAPHMKSENTKSTYLYAVKRICDFFEIEYKRFDPHEMNQVKYDTFLSTRSKELKRASLNLLSNVFNVLSNLYNLGIKVNMLDEIDKHTDYITFSELQEYLNKADKESAAIAAFLFCTGLRTVSVLSIKKEQLMLNAKNPYIKNVYLKGGRRQDIFIMYPDLVKPLLNWYMQYKTSKVKGYDKIERLSHNLF